MMKRTSVVGDASMFITGKLTEIIDGDVVSESKKEGKEYSAQDMEIQSDGNIKKHSQKTVYNNGSEQSNSH